MLNPTKSFRDIVIFGLLAICSLAHDPLMANELERQLNKNDGFKVFTDRVDSDANLNKGTAEFQKFLERKKPTPSEEAKVIYQEDINAQPCSHCPKYLDLTLAVNKIVEKVKTDKSSVADSNESMIQLNKLKFLYYVVRSESDNGEVRCQKLSDQTLLTPVNLEGHTKLLSESMLNMSDVTSVQYIPQGKQEVYYYYKGEGANSNVVIEVVMQKDGSARIRYYDYENRDPGFNLPDLGTAKLSNEKPRGDNYTDFGFNVKTRNTAIPTDINFLNAGLKTQIAENVTLTSKNEVNFNQQSTTVALKSDSGSSWVELEGTNVTNGNKSFTTRIPVEVTIQKESNLKLGASVERNFSIDDISKANNLRNFDQSQTVQLGLTDHNNQYFNVKAISDKDDKVSSYSVSNKFAVGEESSIGASYEENIASPSKKFSINSVASLGGNGKLTTSFGTENDNRFIQTQYEKKISDRTSMVFTVKTDDRRNNSIMYQFETKF